MVLPSLRDGGVARKQSRCRRPGSRQIGWYVVDNCGRAEGIGSRLLNGERRALPEGASLDDATRAFYWQPAAGILGSFELEFVAATGGVVRMRAVVAPPPQ